MWGTVIKVQCHHCGRELPVLEVEHPDREVLVLPHEGRVHLSCPHCGHHGHYLIHELHVNSHHLTLAGAHGE